ncbi:MAG TPA: sugar phosphate nucleotidyltransferase [Planococcus sp. (in: firmicutes)]|nr:sugar phosphate nucleotidyltransferase [Planococcus sp. (in: firmicutes)]
MSLMAVIDSSCKIAGLQDLTIHRTSSSVPFAGRYRLIDFPLSNLVNSGVTSVGVFPSYPFASLMDHIGMGKSWDLDRRRDGLFFMPTTQRNGGYSTVGAFASLEEHSHFFRKSKCEYVVITNSFVITQLDYEDMLDFHKESGADITQAMADGVPLKSFILSKKLLMNLIETHRDRRVISVEDVVKLQRKPFTFAEYQYAGYVAMIDSIQSYFSESLALLNQERRESLFLPDRPIFTKVKDEPPTRYVKGSRTKRAMVANGSTINGSVTNCIIGRAVVIEENTQVRNSLIMQKSYIEKNCDLSYVIADKEVHIEEGVSLHGTLEQPIVLRKGERVKKEDQI